MPDLTTALAGKVGFTITVPDSWYELDLEPSTRERNIRILVEDRCRGNDVMWAQRYAIQKALLEQAQVARDNGATYCASFAIPTDDGPITGSLTISLVVDPRSIDEPGASRETFPEVGRGPDPTLPFAHSSVVDVDGAGRCVRTQGIEDTPLGQGHFLRNVFMLTVVPLDDLDRVFLLTASSPVVDLADSLLDLFDAACGTFRVVRTPSTGETA